MSLQNHKPTPRLKQSLAVVFATVVIVATGFSGYSPEACAAEGQSFVLPSKEVAQIVEMQTSISDLAGRVDRLQIKLEESDNKIFSVIAVLTCLYFVDSRFQMQKLDKKMAEDRRVANAERNAKRKEDMATFKDLNFQTLLVSLAALVVPLLTGLLPYFFKPL